MEALRSRAVGAGTTLLVHAGIGWLLWAGLGTPARTAPQPLAVRFVHVAPPARGAAAPQPQDQRIEEPAKAEPASVKASPEVASPEPAPKPDTRVEREPPRPKPDTRVERKPPHPKPELPQKRPSREHRIVQPVEQAPAAAPSVTPPEPVVRTAEREPPVEHAPAAATSPLAAAPSSIPAPAHVPAASAAPPAAIASAVPAAAQAAVPITLPSSDAAYLRNPAPAYPSIARRLREQGLVVLRVFVQPDGRPSEVAVGTSSGSRRLDSAARDAVRAWTFVPAHRGREPVAAWVLVPVHFRLDNG